MFERKDTLALRDLNLLRGGKGMEITAKYMLDISTLPL